MMRLHVNATVGYHCATRWKAWHCKALLPEGRPLPVATGHLIEKTAAAGMGKEESDTYYVMRLRYCTASLVQDVMYAMLCDDLCKYFTAYCPRCLLHRYVLR